MARFVLFSAWVRAGRSIPLPIRGADFDDNGVVNAADPALFLTQHSQGLPNADINADGVADAADLVAFMAAHGP